MPIRATGRGKIASEAVSDAIKTAVLQVNGTTVDLNSTGISATLNLSIGKKDIDLKSSAFAEMISEHSRGAVTDFRIVSLEKSFLEGLYVAVIDAHIARFRPPEDSKRIKVVVAPVRFRGSAYTIGEESVSAKVVGADLRQKVIDDLMQTGRFSVLDREFNDEVSSELDLVSSGQAPNADFGKLGQALSADLIWVGTIESLSYQKHSRNLVSSDRKLESYSGGATLSHRLINVATRQILFSDSVKVAFPTLGPTTLGLTVNPQEKLAELESDLASQVVPNVVLRLFPVTVLSKSGNAVILSQGGRSIREHETYQMVLMGQELKDPQTGQSLGRTEMPCCVVDIDRVTPTMSYGTLNNIVANIENAAPGSLQLRGRLTTTADSPAQTAAAPISTGSNGAIGAPAKPKPQAVDSHPAQQTDKAQPAPDKDKNW